MYEHDPLTHRIIGCGIEVHRVLGPGLTEPSYERAFCMELTAAGLVYERQLVVPVIYKVPSSESIDLISSSRIESSSRSKAWSG